MGRTSQGEWVTHLMTAFSHFLGHPLPATGQQIPPSKLHSLSTCMILAPREMCLWFDPEGTFGCCSSAPTSRLGDSFKELGRGWRNGQTSAGAMCEGSWRFWRDTGDKVAAERCRIWKTHGLGYKSGEQSRNYMGATARLSNNPKRRGILKMEKLETSSVTRASYTNPSHKAMSLAATALSLWIIQQSLWAVRYVLKLNNSSINLLL